MHVNDSMYRIGVSLLMLSRDLEEIHWPTNTIKFSHHWNRPEPGEMILVTSVANIPLEGSNFLERTESQGGCTQNDDQIGGSQQLWDFFHRTVGIT